MNIDSAAIANPTADLDRLGDEIAELSAHLEAAGARLLDLIREFDERGGWGNGFRSCAHWLSWRVGMDLGAARERVRVARALASLPRFAEALARGELSYAKVRALTRVATPETEERLLTVAGSARPATSSASSAAGAGSTLPPRRESAPSVTGAERFRSSAGRSITVTRVAASLAAASASARATTSGTGPTVARRRSPTSPCYAAAITAPSTRRASRSNAAPTASWRFALRTATSCPRSPRPRSSPPTRFWRCKR